MGNGHSSLGDESNLNRNTGRLVQRDNKSKNTIPSNRGIPIAFPPLPVHGRTNSKPEVDTDSTIDIFGPTRFDIPTLDFDNMPFLRPPEESDHSKTGSFYASPSLSIEYPCSPGSVATEWNGGHSKHPTYHRANSSANFVQGIKADIRVEPDFDTVQTLASSHFINHQRSEHPFVDANQMNSSQPLSFTEKNLSPTVSEKSFHAGSPTESSISSQLSLLSHKYPSGNTSPRSHRCSFHSLQLSEGEVDANMPPPVPPHYVVPSNSRYSSDSLMESAMAAVTALEYEAEEDLNISRSRPRSLSTMSRPRSLSQSASRSVSRPRSRVYSFGSSSDSSSPTDIYTRKCSTHGSPELIHCDDTDIESLEPQTPERSSFVLDGYNEGSTVLRVVNSEDGADDDVPSVLDLDFSMKPKPSEKYFVKSKAQLALEEEQRQRRRYARYGQPFRGHTHSASIC